MHILNQRLLASENEIRPYIPDPSRSPRPSAGENEIPA